ncbi:MAG TPA: CSLREA domain-containing protein, partial [Ardenticatenaceae bacterium]|nr:CSLREA domain-containing protein [Ardenticatenaceae bacterium]
MPYKRLVSPLAYLLAFLTLAVLSTGPAGSNGAVPDRTSQTFTVDSTADVVDQSPGNGTCATSHGSCTLRAAIQEANAREG